jgi:hypothetical protein
MRLTGSYPLSGKVELSYAAEAAHQRDYGNNPASLGENYFFIEPAISAYGFSLKSGYERLQGNGINAFQTPLASYHPLDGWADKFQTTPANGLQNMYVALNYKVPFGEEWMLKDTLFVVKFHDWDATQGSAEKYGTEWDWMISQTFFKHYELGVEGAHYQANASNATTQDTNKIFAWLRVRY